MYEKCYTNKLLTVRPARCFFLIYLFFFFFYQPLKRRKKHLFILIHGRFFFMFFYNPKSEKVGTVWKTQIKKESSDF